MRERFTSGCFEVAVCFRALSTRNSLLRFPKTNEMYQFGAEIRADEAQANVQLRFDRMFSQFRDVVFGCSLLWKMLCDTSR